MALRKRKVNRPHLVIISGMSGAGRSAASKALEDAGFFVIDNLPADLISEVVARSDLREGRRRRLAVVVDTRGGLDFGDLDVVMRRLGAEGVVTTVLSSTPTTRRWPALRGDLAAPLSRATPWLIPSPPMALRDPRGRADVNIDTIDRNVQARQAGRVSGATGHRRRRSISPRWVQAWRLRQDLPLCALANPHWDEYLRRHRADVLVRQM
jgi:UPF0042 nucleotide-binding protein